MNIIWKTRLLLCFIFFVGSMAPYLVAALKCKVRK
jgi:hypothetical protein